MKTLVAYYSWSGNTRKVAEKIHKQISESDLIEIRVPAETFSEDMYQTNDIFKEQVKNKQFPKIVLPATDFQNYDLILIGSPVWSGMPASPIKTCLDKLRQNDYQGKIASFFTDVGQEGNYAATFKSWSKDLKLIGIGKNDSKVNEWLSK
ncbi:flavodoxin family protein [Lactobacillus sp. PV034]|uniref:flavodoxin family protein n=1 Tax=Lactobacillus sp. PV034 TaxID=2594495 RepID=UPI00223FCA3D|nr:flavodoxin [Lactobacillus sp. PV034]QNQ80291.1 transcriptional regulator [Lactobacillus sp. PV034]